MAGSVMPVYDEAHLKQILSDHHSNEPKQQLLVLEFMAPWSEPYKYMKKVLEGSPAGSGLANKLKEEAVFYTLDIAKFKQFAQRMRVEALPTFLLLRGYGVLDRVVGVDKEELEDSILRNSLFDRRALQVVNPDDDIDEPRLFKSPYAFLKAKLKSFF